MSNLAPLVFFIWVICDHVASAAQIPLTAAQFLKRMTKNTIIGEYQDGRQWTERFNADGTTLYLEQNFVITGKVVSQSGKVCFTYPTISGATGGCFEIWQRSANCFDFYGISNQPNRTDATNLQKRLSLGWTARAWLSNAPSTCVADQIS